jgi:predicted NAD/FAD-dependent oxidoreductase
VADHPAAARRPELSEPLDRRRIAEEFANAVNMTAGELRAWLETDESRGVGWKGADGSHIESVGHASGRWIAEILDKNIMQLTAEDYAHMRKVVGFVRRHLAQEPANTITSRWRYSLMNWGHDPLKG